MHTACFKFLLKLVIFVLKGKIFCWEDFTVILKLLLQMIESAQGTLHESEISRGYKLCLGTVLRYVEQPTLLHIISFWTWIERVISLVAMLFKVWAEISAAISLFWSFLEPYFNICHSVPFLCNTGFTILFSKNIFLRFLRRLQYQTETPITLFWRHYWCVPYCKEHILNISHCWKVKVWESV